MRERWIEYGKKADFKLWAQELRVSEVTARLIRNRGPESLEEARRYLYGNLRDLADPGRMKDLEKAADRIEECIRRNSLIAVVSDFDDDGIFAGEILYEGIRRLGGRVMLFTPDRVREGYGINDRIVTEAKERGAEMILTCDNGIVAFDPVALAKKLGMYVVITDHHEPLPELPEADAVVDPHRKDCGYPYKDLCGAGVCFQLIREMFRRNGLPDSATDPFLGYLAVATVADVVPLTGENRILVQHGLKVLRNTGHPGLLALMNACGIRKETLNAHHLGFVIGPCFNAVGRLADVKLAFRLLQTEDPGEAEKAAEEMVSLNELRKSMTEEGTEKALKLLEDPAYGEERVLLLPLSGVHESVIGIIAGRIREKLNRPVIVFSGTEEGLLKGSGRSVEGYHMQRELLACSDLLIRFGGHAMAAGLTLKTEELPALRKRLNEACRLTEEDLVPRISIDVRLPLCYVTEELLGELELLEPFGTGNPKPVFARAHFRIRSMRRIGKNLESLRLCLTDEQGVGMEALLFREAEELDGILREAYGEEELRKGYRGQENSLDAAFTYYPRINEYMGTRTLQIVCQSACIVPQKKL